MVQISKEGSDFQSHPDCQYPALLLNHVFHDFSKFSVKKKSWGAQLGFSNRPPFPCSHFGSLLKLVCSKVCSSSWDVRRQPSIPTSDLWDSEFHRVRPADSRLLLCPVFALVPDWSIRLWSFTGPNPCVGAKICLSPLRGGLLMPLPLFYCLNCTKKVCSFQTLWFDECSADGKQNRGQSPLSLGSGCPVFLKV